MTQQMSGGAPTGEVARDQAGHVGHSAADASRHVAGTAAEQAGDVVHETRRQASDLLQQARVQAAHQARGGQQQAAKGLRALATELHQMADGGDEHGPASDLAKQAAGRVEDIAGWVDRHEPGDIVDQVRRLARRRPGAFLLGAALAGVVAGRLTRGTVDANRSDAGSERTDPTMRPAASMQGYPAPPPMPYDQPRGATLPPAGPLGEPGLLPPHPGPGSVSPPVGPGPSPYPAPVPGGPSGPDGPVPPPAHSPRPGSTTVGEYVDDLERRGSGGPR
jgi:hypothetical protein